MEVIQLAGPATGGHENLGGFILCANLEAEFEQQSQQTFQTDAPVCSVQGGPALEGDTNGDGRIDLLDLSNMFDWFGFNDSREDWADWHIYFDFNGNGEIDIYDIAYVARLMDAAPKLVPAEEASGTVEAVQSALENLETLAPIVE